MKLKLEYDYPVGKSIESLTEEDLYNLEIKWNKDISDFYRTCMNIKKTELRRDKINKILNNQK